MIELQLPNTADELLSAFTTVREAIEPHGPEWVFPGWSRLSPAGMAGWLGMATDGVPKELRISGARGTSEGYLLRVELVDRTSGRVNGHPEVRRTQTLATAKFLSKADALAALQVVAFQVDLA
jgi:hypothetical protein